MKPLETLKTKDGTQVLLFPLQYLYISQDEYGSYSHSGTLNIDFLGWGPNGRVMKCPYFAPCDLVCVYRSDSAYYNIWNSTKEVLCADGVKRYICLMNIHGNMLFNVGTIKKQGEQIGVTGSYGQATGDHLHLNIAEGHYEGQEQISGNWTLKNSIHIYNACYVNDTIIVEGYGHLWKTYDGPIKTDKIKKSFPWAVYAQKLRIRRHNIDKF